MRACADVHVSELPSQGPLPHLPGSWWSCLGLGMCFCHCYGLWACISENALPYGTRCQAGPPGDQTDPQGQPAGSLPLHSTSPFHFTLLLAESADKRWRRLRRTHAHTHTQPHTQNEWVIQRHWDATTARLESRSSRSGASIDRTVRDGTCSSSLTSQNPTGHPDTPAGVHQRISWVPANKGYSWRWTSCSPDAVLLV